MILWRCDICNAQAERPGYGDCDGWLIRKDIIGETVDLCPDCTDRLVSWLRGEAIIVPIHEEGWE